MKHYLEERLHELRNKYRDTGDSKYRYKFEEVQRALEHLLVVETTSTQSTRRSESRGETSPSPSYTSLNCNGGLDSGLKWGNKAVKFTHEE